MSKVTQEAYDEEIRELMEDLGMTEEEAIQDAIKGYEMKVTDSVPVLFITVFWAMKDP